MKPFGAFFSALVLLMLLSGCQVSEGRSRSHSPSEHPPQPVHLFQPLLLKSRFSPLYSYSSHIFACPHSFAATGLNTKPHPRTGFMAMYA